MNSAAQGEKALAESNAPLAIQHFTRALTELPRAPTYYIQRSTAYSRVKPADGGPKPRQALRDAEIALSLAFERGKRELILSAQMRRAVSLFQLEQYGDAKFIFELIEAKTGGQDGPQSKYHGVKTAIAGSRDKKNGYGAELPIWIAKTRRKLSELAEGDAKAAVSVVEYPTGTKIPSEKELKTEWERLKAGKSAEAADDTAQKSDAKTSGVSGSAEAQKQDSTEQKAPVASAPAPEKVRHEWYQSHDSVVVTLYAKGVPKDRVETELKDESVCPPFS